MDSSYLQVILLKLNGSADLISGLYILFECKISLVKVTLQLNDHVKNM